MGSLIRRFKTDDVGKCRSNVYTRMKRLIQTQIDSVGVTYARIRAHVGVIDTKIKTDNVGKCRSNVWTRIRRLV